QVRPARPTSRRHRRVGRAEARVCACAIEAGRGRGWWRCETATRGTRGPGTRRWTARRRRARLERCPRRRLSSRRCAERADKALAPLVARDPRRRACPRFCALDEKLDLAVRRPGQSALVARDGLKSLASPVEEKKKKVV